MISDLKIEYKENLLCNMNEFDDLEWTELLIRTISINKHNNKYTPKTYDFYNKLKSRNVKCRKFGNTIVFEIND